MFFYHTMIAPPSSGARVRLEGKSSSLPLIHTPYTPQALGSRWGAAASRQAPPNPPTPLLSGGPSSLPHPLAQNLTFSSSSMCMGGLSTMPPLPGDRMTDWHVLSQSLSVELSSRPGSPCGCDTGVTPSVTELLSAG